MSESKEMMFVWYERAQIEYTQKYMALYAAFNAWYRGQTHTTNDRQALTYLGRTEHSIWQDYRNGHSLLSLGSIMGLLVELTQREPLSYTAPHWKGEVTGRHDWASLIEYWYRVRCLVMHGAHIDFQYVHLAYETLNCFMGEVIRRARY